MKMAANEPPAFGDRFYTGMTSEIGAIANQRAARRTNMRQKYRICPMQEEKMLNIKEFAVLEKDTKNVDSTMLRDDHFSLICEQNYDYAAIAQSAAEGLGELVDALRTPNLFPIADYAEKIAESVIALVDEDTDHCVELFFDDNEWSVVDVPAPQ
jgi:hypothetical protein